MRTPICSTQALFQANRAEWSGPRRRHSRLHFARISLGSCHSNSPRPDLSLSSTCTFKLTGKRELTYCTQWGTWMSCRGMYYCKPRTETEQSVPFERIKYYNVLCTYCTVCRCPEFLQLVSPLSSRMFHFLGKQAKIWFPAKVSFTGHFSVIRTA